jgi:hypothetical protein
LEGSVGSEAVKLVGKARKVDRSLLKERGILREKSEEKHFGVRQAEALKILENERTRHILARAIAAGFEKGRIRPTPRGKGVNIALRVEDIYDQMALLGFGDLGMKIAGMRIWNYITDWAEHADDRTVDQVMKAREKRRLAAPKLTKDDIARKWNEREKAREPLRALALERAMFLRELEKDEDNPRVRKALMQNAQIRLTYQAKGNVQNTKKNVQSASKRGAAAKL